MEPDFVGVADRVLLVKIIAGLLHAVPTDSDIQTWQTYKRGRGTPDTSHSLGDDVAGGTFLANLAN